MMTLTFKLESAHQNAMLHYMDATSESVGAWVRSAVPRIRALAFNGDDHGAPYYVGDACRSIPEALDSLEDCLRKWGVIL